ncbi:DUF4192 domain-containing protein [Pedococcus sp. 5OH_020]|uniref:DUF4192 domain-containing protein n=1 Tax=Pedococcus sp. 5OH_020 TaxID=2989814 RepID=UPI0022E9E129|nr:DUF4192 domain-containing protein [Pedococcus sp. 5OH_020]
MTHALRLASPGDLIAVVPYLLGFHPTDSVVVLCVHDGRLGLLQRLDLPTRGQEDDVADALLPALVRERPDAVLVIGYEDSPRQSVPVLAAVDRALRTAGIPVKDRLVVHDGRWRSLDCDNPSCCPPGGTPVPDPVNLPAIAAEFVGHEVAPHPDRASLARQLEPHDDALIVAALIEGRHTTDRSQGVSDPSSVWAAVLDASDTALPLTASDAASAALSLGDVRVRDALVAWLTPGTIDPAVFAPDVQRPFSGLERPWDEHDSDATAVVAQNRVQARLVRLCAMLPDQHAAPALTVLGCFTWWRGNGALTRAALDRALRCQPEYRLALLLEAMVDLAIRPRPHS